MQNGSCHTATLAGRGGGLAPGLARTRRGIMSRAGIAHRIDLDQWVRPPPADCQPPGSRATPLPYACPPRVAIAARGCASRTAAGPEEGEVGRHETLLTATAPASGVKAAIEAAILRNAQLDSREIIADVNGGEVTLRGIVRSWAERRQAEYVAWSASGVTSVKNELAVTA